MIRIAASLAAVLVLSACIVPVPVPLPAPSGDAAQVSRLAANYPARPRFDTLLNGFRAANGRALLASNAGLDRIAAAHAADMRAGGYIAHRDRAGLNATGRVRAAGVSRCQAGENLARGQGSAERVFRDWASSPGHRRNMLNRSYVNYGFARSGDYWVLVMLQAC